MYSLRFQPGRGFWAFSLVLGLSSAACVERKPSTSATQTPAPQQADAFASPAPDSLRALADQQKKFIGTALATWHFGKPNYKEISAAQFNSLTAENEMKWEALEKQQGQFSFGPGDALVAFAEQHHMRVRGHTLVWHSQLAPWVKGLSGDKLRAAMLHHVKTTAEHWKGRIAQWDVVNEAIGDDGELRKDSPFTALGKEYIAEAFRAAHAADPAAQLFYNDYEAEGLGTPKSEGQYRLIQQLKQEGVPIHGVGFQMHVEPRKWPTAEEIRKNLERFVALGLTVELTEFDVPVGEVAGTPAEKLEWQKKYTHDIAAACFTLPACTGITLWGVNDAVSWLSTPEWGKLRGKGPHLPLPFDAEGKKKPMFDGIAAALQGK